MWAFIKIPPLPLEACDGAVFVALQKYYVCEGETVEVGQRLALAKNACAEFEILSDFKGRVEKLILKPGKQAVQVAYGSPIATMKIISSGTWGRTDEPCRVLRVLEKSPAIIAKVELLKNLRDLVLADKQSELELWIEQHKQQVEDTFCISYRRMLEKPQFFAARTALADFGLELEKTYETGGL